MTSEAAEDLKISLALRQHPSVRGAGEWLIPNPNLPSGTPSALADLFASFTNQILLLIPNDDPELTNGLHDLVRAKDCVVRASIRGSR
jgi:hypothetical protein